MRLFWEITLAISTGFLVGFLVWTIEAVTLSSGLARQAYSNDDGRAAFAGLAAASVLFSALRLWSNYHKRR